MKRVILLISLDERLMRKGTFETDLEILCLGKIESNESLLKNSFEMEKFHYLSALTNITSIHLTLWAISIMTAAGNLSF